MLLIYRVLKREIRLLLKLLDGTVLYEIVIVVIMNKIDTGVIVNFTK